jgi:L-lactate dehydrogenase (cytochrome)
VIKALALGAKGVLVGRAYVYGLGAMGEAGVAKALQIIGNELDVTMALCGLRDVRQVTADILVRPQATGLEGVMAPGAGDANLAPRPA